MVQSKVKPKVVEIDNIKNGKVDILVHWNVREIEHEEEKIWVYEECAMRGDNGWILPRYMESYEEIEIYLMSIENELLDWAKGSKVTIK